jgi:exodeoxyribonuclease-3
VRFATWNVNSIRARSERVLAWLDQHRPDVICLQETKVDDAAFPVEPYRARGYHLELCGQPTYNGVAILSLLPLTDVSRGLGDGEEDGQCRLIAATVAGVRVLSVYAPNGQVVGSDKWVYKLRWFERLRRYLGERESLGGRLVLGGDFNVAPEPRDVHDPARWEKEVLFHPDARAALARLCDLGLADTYRLHHPEPGRYTWWDYRQLSFPKGRGLRIDHVLATAPLFERCRAAEIDREARKGKQPSDHAPLITTFDV